MSGFIAVSRDFWNDPDFRDAEMSPREAMLWMLAEASWKTRRKRVGSAVIELHRGQLAHSTRFLAAKFQWSEARVRRYLKVLKERSIIDAQTDAGVTVITFCNYDKYQRPERASDAPRDAAATQERRTSDANEYQDNQDTKGERARERAEPPPQPPTDLMEGFNAFWAAYPEGPNKGAPKLALSHFRRLTVDEGVDRERLVRAARRYAETLDDPKYGRAAWRWLNDEHWRTEPETRPVDWRAHVSLFAKFGKWIADGPEPGQAGCPAPAEVLEEFGYGPGGPGDRPELRVVGGER